MKLRQVYVVVCSDSYGCHVCEVFIDKKLADEYAAKRKESGSCLNWAVETRPVNTAQIQPKTIWLVYIDKAGNVVESCSWLDWEGYHEQDAVSMCVGEAYGLAYIFARSSRGYDATLKMAKDKLVKSNRKSQSPRLSRRRRVSRGDDGRRTTR